MTNTITNPEAQIAQRQKPDILESLARIGLAGLGGALAGLSVARRRGTFGAATDGILGRRVGELPHIKSSLRLPITWAIGCTTFAGILEFSSLVSPTSLLLNSLHEMDLLGSDEDGLTAPAGKSGVKSNSYLTNHQHHIENLGDFALGGAIAGAIFKGNSISASLAKSDGVATGSDKVGLSSFKMKSTMNEKVSSDGMYKQKKAIGRGKVIRIGMKNVNKPKTVKNGSVRGSAMVPPVLKPRTGIISGLLPGLALGLIAGLIHIFLNELSDMIIKKEIEEQNDSDDDEGKGGGEDDIIMQNDAHDEDFEARVKKMSTAEIQREIEKIKK